MGEYRSILRRPLSGAFHNEIAMNEKIEQLIQVAKEAGAYGAVYLDAEHIVLNPQFEEICRGNNCGRYGKCYMCPPDLGDMETLMARVRKFPRAVIYQTVSPLEDSFDFEGMMEAGAAHSRLSGRIQDSIKGILKQEFLHLSTGCNLCSRCAKMDDLPCRYPERALGAMEGYGFDVYQTVKDTELKYINGVNTVTYFGVILFTE